MGAGTAVLKDDQLQKVTPGNPVSFEARPVDVSQPVAARPGSSVGTNLGGAQGARNTNTAPPVVIPVIPASVVPPLPFIKRAHTHSERARQFPLSRARLSLPCVSFHSHSSCFRRRLAANQVGETVFPERHDSLSRC
jgi:hypothetical protein